MRPLGIPATEDKLLQLAVKRLLEAIYEQDFLSCSYGIDHWWERAQQWMN